MTPLTLHKLQQFKRIHFVGIGGIGMSGLARVLIACGYSISGSDTKSSTLVRQLEQLGCPIHIGHDAFPKQVDCVVYSTAINSDNPELTAARLRGIPVLHRSELLRMLVNQYPSVGVAGTHGKTTTSSMISFLAERTGLRPLCLVGGKVLNFSDHVLLQNREIELVVAEVDESDKSIVHYEPLHAIITNIEEDHLDFYRDLEDIQEAFGRYAQNIRTQGSLIYNQDDANIQPVLKCLRQEPVSFGIQSEANFRATNIHLGPFSSQFDLHYAGTKKTNVTLSVPGTHNIANALASIAALSQLGVDSAYASSFLNEFRGAGRRLEVKLNRPDWVVLDDYAHHPTEVKASLAALKPCGRRIRAVFQPHRFSRVQTLAAQFTDCFNDADELFILDIYPAGEKPIAGVTSDLIVQSISKYFKKPLAVRSKQEVVSDLIKNHKEGDLVVFMGAGDVTELADEFVKQISI